MPHGSLGRHEHGDVATEEQAGRAVELQRCARADRGAVMHAQLVVVLLRAVPVTQRLRHSDVEIPQFVAWFLVDNNDNDNNNNDNDHNNNNNNNNNNNSNNNNR